MDRFGSDKPDLRFGLELKDITDLVADCQFKVFASVCAQGGRVKGLRVPGCSHYSRKDIDDLTKMAAVYGAKGLAWISLGDEGPKSPFLNFFRRGTLRLFFARLEAGSGDLLLFVADRPEVAEASLGFLREEFGKRLQLIDHDQFSFCWVVDFPLLEYDQEEKRYVAIHHPFTSPVEEDLELLEKDPARVPLKLMT